MISRLKDLLFPRSKVTRIARQIIADAQEERRYGMIVPLSRERPTHMTCSNCGQVFPYDDPEANSHTCRLTAENLLEHLAVLAKEWGCR